MEGRSVIGKDRIPVGLNTLLSKLGPLKIHFDKDGYEEDAREKIDNFTKANAISSIRNDKMFGERHAILIDLDVPAYLVDSSTPGHSHLYIDVSITKHQLFRILEALTDCGVVQSGFTNVSITRGHTSLRLPWVNKSAQSMP